MGLEGTYLSIWQSKDLGKGKRQVIVDLPRLRASFPAIQFLYVKATQGLTAVDPTFGEHRAAALAAGYPSGAFHYFTNRDDPIAQAKHFWSVAGGSNHGWRVLPAIDVEDVQGTGDSGLADKVYACLRETENLWGVKPIIYTRMTYWNPYIRKNAPKPDSRFAGYLWWVAHYNDFIAKPWLPVDASDYAIWQVGQRAPYVLPGLPCTHTIERLNPLLRVEDLCFPLPAQEKPESIKALVYSLITIQEVLPGLDISIFQDNLTLMLDDLKLHGQVAPYASLPK